MKKATLPLLCLLCFILFSCDSSSGSKDPILGKWEYVTGSINGIITVNNDCKPYITIFKSNTLGSVTTYQNNGVECVEASNDEYNWTKTSNGQYELTFTNPSGEITYDWDAVFSSNNSVVTLTRSAYEEGSTIQYHYMVQFHRI